jgi:N-acetylglutamate synthase-like GNAT family acetyltransferase
MTYPSGGTCGIHGPSCRGCMSCRDRGQGVGRALVARVEAQAHSMGVVRLYLYTAQARGLYEQLGWDSIGADVAAGAA